MWRLKSDRFGLKTYKRVWRNIRIKKIFSFRKTETYTKNFLDECDIRRRLHDRVQCVDIT